VVDRGQLGGNNGFEGVSRERTNNPCRITFHLFVRPSVQLLDKDDALYVKEHRDLTPITAYSITTFGPHQQTLELP